MKEVGFWRATEDSDENLPWPVHSDKPFDNKDVFLQKLSEIEELTHKIYYRGMSLCRCCRNVNGSFTHEYQGWAWPQGYIHYIKVHNVVPPKDFYDFVLSTMTPQSSIRLSNAMVRALETINSKTQTFKKA